MPKEIPKILASVIKVNISMSQFVGVLGHPNKDTSKRLLSFKYKSQ